MVLYSSMERGKWLNNIVEQATRYECHVSTYLRKAGIKHDLLGKARRIRKGQVGMIQVNV